MRTHSQPTSLLAGHVGLACLYVHTCVCLQSNWFVLLVIKVPLSYLLSNSMFRLTTVFYVDAKGTFFSLSLPL